MLNDDKKLDKRTPNALNVCNSVEGGDWLRFSLKFPASHESKVGEKRKLRNTLRNKNLRTYVGGGGVEGVIRKFEDGARCHLSLSTWPRMPGAGVFFYFCAFNNIVHRPLSSALFSFLHFSATLETLSHPHFRATRYVFFATKKIRLILFSFFSSPLFFLSLLKIQFNREREIVRESIEENGIWLMVNLLLNFVTGNDEHERWSLRLKFKGFMGSTNCT